MVEKDEKIIVLRSFTNIKNLETKIYKVGNIKLIAPLPLQSLGVFLIVDAVMVLINLIIRLPLNGTIKYLIIPFLLTMFFKKAQIDGKAPHIYVMRLLEYQSIKKAQIERFEIRKKEKVIEFE